MVIHRSLILAEENKQLKEENTRQKWKRAQKCLYIGTEGLLTIAEGLHWVETNRVVEKVAEEVEEDQSQQLRQYTLPKYSLYSSLLYKAPRYPSLQET
jgi:hypothetical protein